MSLIAPQDAAFLLGETAAQPTHVAGLAVYELPPGADPDYVSRLYHELLENPGLRYANRNGAQAQQTAPAVRTPPPWTQTLSH